MWETLCCRIRICTHLYHPACIETAKLDLSSSLATAVYRRLCYTVGSSLCPCGLFKSVRSSEWHHAPVGKPEARCSFSLCREVILIRSDLQP